MRVHVINIDNTNRLIYNLIMPRKRVYYDLEKISQLETEGRSIRSIAKELDIEPSMLSRWLKQHTNRKVTYSYKRFHGPRKGTEPEIRGDSLPLTPQ